VNNKRGTLLLAAILAVPAFAAADGIPGHSKGGTKYVSLSEGFTGEQDLQGSSARCSFLFSSVRDGGIETSSTGGVALSDVAKGDMSAKFGVLGAGVGSDSRPAEKGDFDADHGASSEGGSGKGRGDHHWGDLDGTGEESSFSSTGISVAEPGSQAFLLFGLAALGTVFYRRITLRHAT